jgi:hypothetical protein
VNAGGPDVWRRPLAAGFHLTPAMVVAGSGQVDLLRELTTPPPSLSVAAGAAAGAEAGAGVGVGVGVGVVLEARGRPDAGVWEAAVPYAAHLESAAAVELLIQQCREFPVQAVEAAVLQAVRRGNVSVADHHRVQLHRLPAWTRYVALRDAIVHAVQTCGHAGIKEWADNLFPAAGAHQRNPLLQAVRRRNHAALADDLSERWWARDAMEAVPALLEACDMGDGTAIDLLTFHMRSRTAHVTASFAPALSFDALRTRALRKAVLEGRLAAMHKLQALGAALDAADERPGTTMRAAVRALKWQSVHALVCAGADTNIDDNAGGSLLHTVARSDPTGGDELDTAVAAKYLVRLLVDRGAVLNAADAADRSPLMVAVHNPEWSAAPVVDAFLRAGADAAVVDDDRRNLLTQALMLGKVDVMRVLQRRTRMMIPGLDGSGQLTVAAWADAAADARDWDALATAAPRMHLTVADAHGQTALHWAVSQLEWRAVTALLDAGAEYWAPSPALPSCLALATMLLRRTHERPQLSAHAAFAAGFVHACSGSAWLRRRTAVVAATAVTNVGTAGWFVGPGWVSQAASAGHDVRDHGGAASVDSDGYEYSDG